MSSSKAKRMISAATVPGLVLGTFVILNSTVDADAMSLFGGSHHNSGPHQRIVPSNNNSSNNGTTGSNGSLSITANPVVVNPEPSTLILLASGLLGLGVWSLRRRP
jgi:hypothetical protein